MPRTKFIAYVRVSTDQQGRSGLGLEAQQATIQSHIGAVDGELVQQFIEVESGRRSDRPQLAKVLAACRVYRATLLVAKVDRLTRSVAFLSTLMESGVHVTFCDLPQVSGPTGRFMLTQLAAVAELEAGLISQRTKAALSAATARGVKLGNPRGLSEAARCSGIMASVEARHARSQRFAEGIRPMVEQAKAEGHTSFRQIAAWLTDKGVPTARGGAVWDMSMVRRIAA